MGEVKGEFRAGEDMSKFGKKLFVDLERHSLKRIREKKGGEQPIEKRSSSWGGEDPESLRLLREEKRGELAADVLM